MPSIQKRLTTALIFHQQAQFDRAQVLYDQVLSIDPNNADALHLKGVLLHQTGDLKKAIEFIQKAISKSAPSPVYYFNLGNVYKDLDQNEKAVEIYQRVLKLDPNNYSAHINLGLVYKRMNQLSLSIACFRQGIAVDPSNPNGYNNLGIALMNDGNLAEAQTCFEKAVEVKFNFYEAINNLGNVFKAQFDLLKAIDCYRQSIEIKPDYISAYINLGATFSELGQIENAIVCYKNALAINAKSSQAIADLVFNLMKVCAWDALSFYTQQLDQLNQAQLAEGKKTPEMPFQNLSRHINPKMNFQVAASWSQEIENRICSTNPQLKFRYATKEDKIILGYISSNFKDHPTAHLIGGLFNLHDRSKFKVIVYSTGEDDGSVHRKKIMQSCDVFVDISQQSPTDIAHRINQDGVTILIDLMGLTKGDTMAVAALRPAPIQVRYLGMPGTTGAGYFDYIITDSIVTPPAHARFYSEQFIYMPNSYQINDNSQPISTNTVTRIGESLPASGFIFCSFNQAYKITKETFFLWMDILKDVPKSVLWLPQGPEQYTNNLSMAAIQKGIQPQRLVFAAKKVKSQHLKRLSLANLALDTITVNGAATTSDALWAGVPVLTLKGDHFASCMSASILTAIDLRPLVTFNHVQYKSAAIQLATNPDFYLEIFTTLARNKNDLPLFDTHKFVAHLEHAFQKIYERYCAQLPPQQIDLH